MIEALHPDRLLAEMPRAEIIAKSLTGRGALIHTRSMEEACEISNRIAPEHLEIASSDPHMWEPQNYVAGPMLLKGYPGTVAKDRYLKVVVVPDGETNLDDNTIRVFTATFTLAPEAREAPGAWMNRLRFTSSSADPTSPLRIAACLTTSQARSRTALSSCL